METAEEILEDLNITPETKFHSYEYLYPTIVKAMNKYADQRVEASNDRWISVSERWPGRDERVLGLVDGSIRFVSYGKANHVPLYGWYCVDGDPEDRDGASNMTHWQPLPEIPK